MNQYIYDKVYNTPYRDLVPLILANALDINIETISDGNPGLEALTIYTFTCQEAVGEIIIFKSSAHYDGIILKQKRPHLNSGYLCDVNYTETTGGASPGRCKTHDDASSVHYDNDRPETIDRLSLHIFEDHSVTPETDVSVASSARVSTASGCTICIYDPNAIKICCWNVNGLTQTKLSNDLIGGYISDFDTVLLCETWTADEYTYELQGYTFYNYPLPFKHHNTGRCSGGLGLFIRKKSYH